MKVSRLARPRELLSMEDGSATYDGDDVDFTTSPEGGSAPSSRDEWKSSVRVATTAAITIATDLNAGDTIDGVTLVAGDRVLVKDQAAPAENGIWVAGASPERAADMDDDDEVLGAIVGVREGTANAGTPWRATNTTEPVIGTDAITFEALAAGEPTADAHIADAVDAHDATAISFAPAGSIAATNVQAAIEEVASEASGVTYGTPAIVLGTAAAAGAIDEAIRRDSTIVAFDATAPVTLDYDDVAAAGAAAVAARRDHVHGMPAAGGGLALSDATPIVESGAGSAGTGTEASRDDHVHPADGGGGGGGTFGDGKPYIWTPPGSPATEDDEFADGTNQSGPTNGLDAKWSKHNLGTAGWLVLDDSKAPGCLLLDIPTGQAADQWIYQAVPSGDWILHVSMALHVATDRQMWALGCVDTSGNGVCVCFDGGVQNFSLRTVSAWAQIGTQTVINLSNAPGTQAAIPDFLSSSSEVFMALQRVSGAYSASGGRHPRLLPGGMKYTAHSTSFTAAYIGVGRIYGTGASQLLLDWFRKS